MTMSRNLAAGAAVWALAYAGGYVALVRQQADTPVAWWYVAVIATGVVALGAVPAGAWGRSGVVLGLVALAVASLLGLLSIGIFLVPAVVTAVIALIRYPSVAVTPPG